MDQASETHPRPGNTGHQQTVWPDIARSGAWAGALSMLALVVAGRIERGSGAAALNAPAHWLWGQESLRRDDWSLRHTATGAAIHLASAGFWAGLMHAACPRAARERPVATAAVTTATAAFVDLALTPERLTPGFERRLSPRSLAWTYGLFALGLALAARPRAPQRAEHPRHRTDV